MQSLDGSPAKPVSGEGVHLIAYTNLISPDGRQVAAIGPDRTISLFPLRGGEPRRIPGLAPGEVPSGWDAGGKALFVYQPGELPARIALLDIESGDRKPVTELMPGDPTGITYIRPPHFTPDGSGYAYSYSRTLSKLYLIKGLR